MSRYTALIERGYFPKELPPVFSTKALAKALNKRSAPTEFTAIHAAPKKSCTYFHSMVRAGHLRRKLGIPNPIHYSRICKYVAQNWQRIKRCAYRSPFSLTKPTDTSGERAFVPEHDLGERVQIRAEQRASSKYLLKTDVG